jgi:RNA polymerase sigma-70 factor (ECF subfamily)
MGMNDHSIIRAVLAGDKDAYGALVARYSQSVFRVAFRITGDEAEADDVVQDAFLRGYQKLESFQSRSDFGTWIYRIAVNCALDSMSKRRVTASYRIEEEADPESMTVQVADSAAGPDRLLLSREIEARQQHAMASLTPTERTAFVLRHMEEQPIDEIAATLGIAPNAAKQVVFRAVQKLRRCLAPLRTKL